MSEDSKNEVNVEESRDRMKWPYVSESSTREKILGSSRIVTGHLWLMLATSRFRGQSRKVVLLSALDSKVKPIMCDWLMLWPPDCRLSN